MAVKREFNSSELLDSLSADELKSLLMDLNVRSGQPERNQDWRRVQQDFVDANPEYVATHTNATALMMALIERGKLTPEGSYLGTMDDMQEAYVDLANKNIIQLKAGARKPRLVEVDEQQLYEMPLDELRSLAFEQEQRKRDGR